MPYTLADARKRAACEYELVADHGLWAVKHGPYVWPCLPYRAALALCRALRAELVRELTGKSK